MNHSTATAIHRVARFSAKLICAAIAVLFVSGVHADENKSVVDALSFTREVAPSQMPTPPAPSPR